MDIINKQTTHTVRHPSLNNRLCINNGRKEQEQKQQQQISSQGRFRIKDSNVCAQ